MRILFLDSGRVLLYDGERFEQASPKLSKHHFTAASVTMSDVITHTIRLPQTIEGEQLQVEVELKMYEEAQLDPNKEYHIGFVKLLVENELIIEAFAYAKEQFERTFGEVAKRLYAIDLLFPSFLAFEALYREKQEEKHEIFIHIGTHEAYALFYKKGRYIGHRLLDSLEVIAKKSGIELAKLTELLATKGLKRERYALDEIHILDALEPIFMQNVEKVVYSINQKRSLFLYDHVDTIYVDCAGQKIEGLESYFAAYGIDDAQFLTFEYRGKGKESYVYLQADYALAIASGSDINSVNLSFLERKPPLWHYRSLQWVASAFFFSLLLGGSYFYLQTFLHEQQKEIVHLQKRLKDQERILKKYRKRIRELEEQKSALIKQKEQKEDTIRTIEVTLETMPLIAKNKMSRERFMNDIVASMAKFGLKSEQIVQKASKWAEVFLVARSDQREEIAKFLQRMLSLGYSRAFTRKIWHEEGVYKSVVRIER